MPYVFLPWLSSMHFSYEGLFTGGPGLVQKLPNKSKLLKFSAQNWQFKVAWDEPLNAQGYNYKHPSH